MNGSSSATPPTTATRPTTTPSSPPGPNIAHVYVTGSSDEKRIQPQLLKRGYIREQTAGIFDLDATDARRLTLRRSDLGTISSDSFWNGLSTSVLKCKEIRVLRPSANRVGSRKKHHCPTHSTFILGLRPVRRSENSVILRLSYIQFLTRILTWPIWGWKYAETVAALTDRLLVESAFGRGRHDTRRAMRGWPLRSISALAAIGLGAVAALLTGESSGKDQAVAILVFGIAGLVVTPPTLAFLAFLVAAPVRQRDEARTELRRLTASPERIDYGEAVRLARVRLLEGQMLAGRLERLVEPGDVSGMLFPSLVTRESETRRDLESYADQWMIAFGSDGFTDVRPDDRCALYEDDQRKSLPPSGSPQAAQGLAL